jgi:hypothetical protein
MTLDDLLLYRATTERHLAEVAVEYNKANKIRREIEANYMISWKSKAKAESLFIVTHKKDWDAYQEWKEELIKAESNEKQANKIYYQARDSQGKWDMVDSAISKLVNDM